MLTECDEEGLKDLLVGHKITQVVDDTLTLDDGTSLYFEGNEGCSSGWYSAERAARPCSSNCQLFYSQ